MHIYIHPAFIAAALALCGGFFIGRTILKGQLQRAFADRYQKLYNLQMDELCTRFRQERAALVHRYEGLAADLEIELRELQMQFDPDKTKISPPTSNQELIKTMIESEASA